MELEVLERGHSLELANALTTLADPGEFKEGDEEREDYLRDRVTQIFHEEDKEDRSAHRLHLLSIATSAVENHSEIKARAAVAEIERFDANSEAETVSVPIESPSMFDNVRTASQLR